MLFQIIPMPLNILKFLSVNKFHYINNLSSDIKTSDLSLSPSDSFFQILHFLTILILIFILKMIFYSESHKRRFFLFIAFIGFISSIFAITLYLNGNPDILIFKNSFYKNSSTGFFINRTVFAIFLLFSLISCLELLKDYQVNVIYQKKDNFFLKIYIRLFLVFITIGIITSFSRIGNFLLIITILSYLLNEFFFTKQKKPFFILSIILIIIFDIMVLGIYFGASELIDRFYFLNEEILSLNNNDGNFKRFEIIKFSINQLSNYFIFGYGSGSYETMFQLNYANLHNKYANHAHSDLVEFLGEFGLIGFLFFLCSIFKFLTNKISYNFINCILFFYLITILMFDFSLHVPIIQIMFIIFLIISNRLSIRSH